MSEIKNIDLSRATNAGHFAFVKSILDKLLACTKLLDSVTAQAGVLKNKFATEDDLFQKSRKNPITDQIKAADLKRDGLFSSVRMMIKAQLNSPIASVAEAAKTLNQVLIDYNIDPQMQIDEENAKVDNYTRDMQEKHATEMDTLGVTAHVAALAEANTEVMTLLSERTDSIGVKVAGALRAARKATDTAYKNLIKRVNALLIVSYDESYDEFVNYANNEIDRFRQQVLTKKTTKKTDSETTEPDEKTPTEE